MKQANFVQAPEAELQKLEEKVEALIRLCKSLQEENRFLKEKYNQLLQEHAQLIEKTAVAKNRVEAIITRLKSIGHGT